MQTHRMPGKHTDKQTHRQKDKYTEKESPTKDIGKYINRQTDRQMHKHTHTGRQTNIKTHRQTGRNTDRNFSDILSLFLYLFFHSFDVFLLYIIVSHHCVFFSIALCYFLFLPIPFHLSLYACTTVCLSLSHIFLFCSLVLLLPSLFRLSATVVSLIIGFLSSISFYLLVVYLHSSSF